MNTKTPTIFVGHSNPMLALDKQAAQEYQAWSRTLPQPKAILVFSAHWEEDGLVFGETTAHSQLIYDFYGFPDPLFRLQYPAPGAPWLAERIDDLLHETIERTDRGIDHGVWVPFLHMWPDADIPILQMSLPRAYSNEALLALGRHLSPLRDEGIMIIGAGTLTHNLREGLSQHHDTPPQWVTEFDEWVEDALLHDQTRILDWEQAPHAKRNHPTPEHFRPLLIPLGASTEDDEITFPIIGYEMEIFSKRSVEFR